MLHFFGSLLLFFGFSIAEIIRKQEKETTGLVPKSPFSLRPLTVGRVFTEPSLLYALGAAAICGFVLMKLSAILDQPEFIFPISALTPLVLVPAGLKFIGC